MSKEFVVAEINVYQVGELSREEWRDLQGIAREAFTHELHRDQQEVDALVGWDDPAAYVASHTDPNVLVGERYTANQSYTRPRVAVAKEHGEAIGFAYSAHNVSGETEKERRLKRLSIIKNYLWIREIAVTPRAQSRNIGTKLGRELLRDAFPLQPVTAYIWPDEAPRMQATLQRLGFGPSGEEPVQIFGESSEPVRQVRMQARSVRSALRQLSLL